MCIRDSYGTGPGTFGAIYQLYRQPGQQWQAYVHDDWLETRITFGGVGFGVALVLLGCVVANWFVGPGIPSSVALVAPIWIALTGNLVHAKFDFPFQVYSVAFLFLLNCTVLQSVSRKRRR